MSTQRQTPRTKSHIDAAARIDAAQPAAQQSSAQAMARHGKENADRQRDALENQGTQGRHPPMTMREEEDDDAATRH